MARSSSWLSDYKLIDMTGPGPLGPRKACRGYWHAAHLGPGAWPWQRRHASPL